MTDDAATITRPARIARPARGRKEAAAPPDRTTAWARAVTAGTIVAGPGVRAAAARHLRDLDSAADSANHRGLAWDLAAATHAIGFFEEVLHLNGGQFEGLPFKLLGWQAFIVASLYGWKRADQSRRFRVAYVETGKGSGKRDRKSVV